MSQSRIEIVGKENCIRKGRPERFEDEQQPYLPLVLSMWKNRYGTYDHLARVKEWSVAGPDDAEAGE